MGMLKRKIKRGKWKEGDWCSGFPWDVRARWAIRGGFHVRPLVVAVGVE
jgi:hypothetical protein